jgi:hypothetical protein
VCEHFAYYFIKRRKHSKPHVFTCYIELLRDRALFHALSASPFDQQLFLFFDTCLREGDKLAGMPEGMEKYEEKCRREVAKYFGPLLQRAYMRRWPLADLAQVLEMAERIRAAHRARLLRERRLDVADATITDAVLAQLSQTRGSIGHQAQLFDEVWLSERYAAVS